MRLLPSNLLHRAVAFVLIKIIYHWWKLNMFLSLKNNDWCLVFMELLFYKYHIHFFICKSPLSNGRSSFHILTDCYITCNMCLLIFVQFHLRNDVIIYHVLELLGSWIVQLSADSSITSIIATVINFQYGPPFQTFCLILWSFSCLVLWYYVLDI